MSVRYFKISLVLLLLLFFLIQAFSAYYNGLSQDEFHSLYMARKTFEFKPYKDWMPFRTSLCLYLDTIPFYFLKDQWQIIHLLKLVKIFLTCAVFYWSARNLSFLGSNTSTLFSLGLLCFNNYFLLGSLELRPDILNSLTGLISFTLLIQGNVLLSGLFAILSFCISQKGAVYFVAANLALIVCVLKSYNKFKDLIKFNLVFAFGLLSYVIYSSLGSSIGLVLYSIFAQHLYLLKEQNYPNLYVYWLSLLADNFLFFAAPAFYAFKYRNFFNHQQLLTFVYSFTALICCLAYPVPLPYFFVIFLPCFYVLNIISIECFMSRKLVMFLLVSILYPLSIYCYSWQGKQSYQQVMTMIGEYLLKDEGHYFAGGSLLIFKEQKPEELAWLDMRKIRQVKESSQEQRAKLLHKFKEDPPKFIFSNVKIDNLPKDFISFFEKNYYHYFGNIYVYSSSYDLSRERIDIKYKGDYRLLSKDVVNFSGTVISPGSVLSLEKNVYLANSKQPFTLIYQPKLKLGREYQRFQEARD